MRRAIKNRCAVEVPASWSGSRTTRRKCLWVISETISISITNKDCSNFFRNRATSDKPSWYLRSLMKLCSCSVEVKTTPVIIGRAQFIITMASTCLVCYEESEIFVLPPCSHTHICWKCCLKLVEGSIFSCPFCKVFAFSSRTTPKPSLTSSSCKTMRWRLVPTPPSWRATPFAATYSLRNSEKHLLLLLQLISRQVHWSWDFLSLHSLWISARDPQHAQKASA